MSFIEIGNFHLDENDDDWVTIKSKGEVLSRNLINVELDRSCCGNDCTVLHPVEYSLI